MLLICLQVDAFSKFKFFGDVAMTKVPIAPTSAVAADVTAVLLVISK